jgi:hypothetical protein
VKIMFRALCLCVVATLSLSLPLQAQLLSVITDDQASRFLGQNVTVEGVVTAVTTSKKGNTFINFGGAYPNQTFTGWIPSPEIRATGHWLLTYQWPDRALRLTTLTPKFMQPATGSVRTLMTGCGPVRRRAALSHNKFGFRCRSGRRKLRRRGCGLIAP